MLVPCLIASGLVVASVANAQDATIVVPPAASEPLTAPAAPHRKLATDRLWLTTSYPVADSAMPATTSS